MFRKLKKNYFMLLMTILTFYFFFNMLDGDRGLISYLEKKAKFNKLNSQQSELTLKIKELKEKNSFLSNNLNLDFVETLIREKFLLIKENEKLYIIKNES